MQPDEQVFLREAKAFLEHDSMLMRMANAAGKPLEWIQRKLPDSVERGMNSVVDKALRQSLVLALKTVPAPEELTWQERISGSSRSRLTHTMATGITGGVGGFFGLFGLAVEMPITTTLMMRNIVSIGNKFSDKEYDPALPLESLYVFSLGSSRSEHDDNLDTAYYTSRFAMAEAMRQGTEFLAKHSAAAVLEALEKGSAPVVIKFIARIAGYFQITMSEKVLAESIPVVGALGGAAINIAFTDYFGQAAKYHFGMLYLEKKYGIQAMKKFYEAA